MSDPKPQSEAALAEAVARGHEPLSASIKGIVVAGVSLLIVVLLSMAGMYALWVGASRPTDEAPPPTELLPPPLVSSVELNPDQPAELRDLRARERERLTSYGWVDRSQKIVHIPIDQALQIVAEKGLPTSGAFAAPPASAASASSTPGATATTVPSPSAPPVSPPATLPPTTSSPAPAASSPAPASPAPSSRRQGPSSRRSP